MLLTLGHREYFNWVSDKSYLKIAFWARMHKKLDLEHPKSFSENCNGSNSTTGIHDTHSCATNTK